MSEKRWKRQGSWSDVNFPTKQRPPSRDSKDKIEPDFTPDPEKMEAILHQRQMREKSKEFAMRKSRNYLERWKAQQLIDNRPTNKKQQTARSSKPVSRAGSTLITASQTHFEMVNSFEAKKAEENRRKAAALREKLANITSKKKE